MNEKDMIEKLKGVTNGSILFISYEPGAKSTKKAIKESHFDTKIIGCNPRHFVGEYIGLQVCNTGEVILIVNVFNRRRDGLYPGGVRSFNPSFGKLHTLEVIEVISKKKTFFQAARDVWRNGTPIRPMEILNPVREVTK